MTISIKIKTIVKQNHLKSRALDLVAFVLLMVVGHAQTGGDQSLHFLLFQAKNSALRASVFALIYKKMPLFKVIFSKS